MKPGLTELQKLTTEDAMLHARGPEPEPEPDDARLVVVTGAIEPPPRTSPIEVQKPSR